MALAIKTVRDGLATILRNGMVGDPNIARKLYGYRTLPTDVRRGIAISYTGGRVVSDAAWAAERYFTIILTASHDKSEADLKAAEDDLITMTDKVESLLRTYRRSDYWLDIEFRQPSIYPDTEKGNRGVRMAWIPIIIKSR